MEKFVIAVFKFLYIILLVYIYVCMYILTRALLFTLICIDALRVIWNVF